MNYTKSQSRSIEQNSDLAVSAGAGSGKTSVLTARILRLIQQGAALNEMLVVTFSNAAAKEMKTRIFSALQKSESKLCFLQLSEIENANICTLHSFCLKLIRENFAALNIDAKVSILSPENTESMKRKCLAEVFAKRYAETSAAFENLLSAFGGLNDNRVKDFILTIHETVSAQSDPKLLHELADRLHSPNFKENILSEIKTIAKNKLFTAKKQLLHIRDLCDADTKQYEVLNTIYEMLGNTDQYPRMSYKGLSEDTQEYMKLTLTKIKKLAKEARELQDTDHSTLYDEELQNISATVKELLAVYSLFLEEYTAEKKQEKVIDFSDCEHYALQLLRKQSADLSHIQYVFVDECQDINPLQDELLKLLSQNAQTFMVGDIKQSIYGFRHALPQLFLQRIQSLAQKGQVVPMNENFRSSKEVINFINALMGDLFNTHGSIAYDESEALIPCADIPGSVHLMLTANVSEEEDNLLSIEREAICVAKKIQDMVQGKTTLSGQSCFSYGDMAILLREIANTGQVYKKVFEHYSIPLAIDAKPEVHPQVRNFINLLSLIHFSDDMTFLCVLRSPVAQFTARELAEIKVASEQESFYECAKEYAQTREDLLANRLNQLFDLVEHFRECERFMPFSEFILYAAQKTKYLTNAGLQGQFKAFLENTLAMEPESLSSFLFTIEEMKKSGSYYNLFKGPAPSDCVSMMTIHKSKGLEFPVVFVCGLNKRFNRGDSQLMVSRELGITPQYCDPMLLKRKKSTLQLAATHHLTQKGFAEELRLLYVALTRAQNHLFLCGGVNHLKSAIFNYLTPKFQESIAEEKSFLDIVMPVLLNMSLQGNIKNYLPDFYENRVGVCSVCADMVENVVLDSAAMVPEYQEINEERLIYPTIEQHPSKISVTQLIYGDKELVTDQAAISSKKSDEAVARGNQIHSILCSIDFHKGFDQLHGEILTSEDEVLLRQFFQTSLFKRIKRAKKVLREQPFCFCPDQRTGTLVQGIIDLCFLEGEKFILVDYKTDSIQKQYLHHRAKRYAGQLNIYSRAIEEITGISVAEKIVYFVSENTGIMID